MYQGTVTLYLREKSCVFKPAFLPHALRLLFCDFMSNDVLNDRELHLILARMIILVYW